MKTERNKRFGRKEVWREKKKLFGEKAVGCEKLNWTVVLISQADWVWDENGSKKYIYIYLGWTRWEETVWRFRCKKNGHPQNRRFWRPVNSQVHRGPPILHRLRSLTRLLLVGNTPMSQLQIGYFQEPTQLQLFGLHVSLSTAEVLVREMATTCTCLSGCVCTSQFRTGHASTHWSSRRQWRVLFRHGWKLKNSAGWVPNKTSSIKAHVRYLNHSIILNGRQFSRLSALIPTCDGIGSRGSQKGRKTKLPQVYEFEVVNAPQSQVLKFSQ